MRLIIGLGNPGRLYAHTRHNVGFDVLDTFAKRKGISIRSRRHKALVGSFDRYGEEIMLVKPQTFMNASGTAVGELMRKYRLEADDIFVVYDDLDLPLGKIRIKPSGSSGGHKGMQSIIQHLHSSDFPRMRIGIGRGGQVTDRVLSRFNKQEQKVMEPTIQRAADALEMVLEEGIEAAMNTYNRNGE